MNSQLLAYLGLDLPQYKAGLAGKAAGDSAVWATANKLAKKTTQEEGEEEEGKLCD